MGYPVETCLNPGDQIEDFICSICLDIMENPVILPCSHKYCRKCMNDIINPKKCALCRHYFHTRDVQSCKAR